MMTPRERERAEFEALTERLLACGVRGTARNGTERITIEAVVERLEELTQRS